MCDNNRRQEVKDILFKNDKTKDWLKKQLKNEGFDVDVYYLLSDNSKNFDVAISAAIDKIFKREGIIANGDDRIKRFTEEFFDLNSIINNSLAIMNRKTKEYFEDNDFEFDERIEALKDFEEMQDKINDIIESIKKVVKK